MNGDGQKYELQLQREEKEVEDLQQRVVKSQQMSVETLADLQKETRVLEDSLAVLREERQTLQNELDSIRKEVGR